MFYRIAGTIDGDEKIIDKLGLEDATKIIDLLRILPDLRWLFEQNPNDYIASVVLQLDDSTLLAVSERQVEYGIPCSECSTYPVNQCPNMHQDEYAQEYCVLMIAPTDIERIDWERGELW